MNKRVAIVLLGVAIGLGVSRYMDKSPDYTPVGAAETLRVCNMAHQDTDDGMGEEACGQLQDEYHLEYLCDKQGVKCWVEELPTIE